ncbi:MAG: hypothetical protein WCZ89_07945 [Phycisphaerae bacterium]
MKEQKDVKKNEQQQDAELDESQYLKEEFAIYIPKKTSKVPKDSSGSSAATK